jgi:o-succinylbenzoate synthase
VKITRIEAFPLALPLAKPFSIALGTTTHTFHVIVRITTDNGLTGYGEGATWHVVYGYDQHSMMWSIERHFAPAIVGMDPFDMERIISTMDRVLPGNHMAKAGIEIACQDLRGKALGIPLFRLLGGRVTDPVEVVAVIDIVPPEEAAQTALEAVQGGYRFIKIKVGIDVKEDVERVAAVRKAVGPDFLLRVDGNQGYDRAEATGACRAFEELGLQWIEQPLPDWDIEGLAALAREFSTPIALDESIYGVHDVYRVARAQAADVINIKVPKCGGITNALKIANAAEAMGIPCFLGGCIESGVGTAAALHFAACCPNLRAGVEMAGSAVFEDDILAEPLILEHGKTELPQGAGIGVQPDPDKLAHYSKAREGEKP